MLLRRPIVPKLVAPTAPPTHWPRLADGPPARVLAAGTAPRHDHDVPSRRTEPGRQFSPGIGASTARTGCYRVPNAAFVRDRALWAPHDGARRVPSQPTSVLGAGARHPMRRDRCLVVCCRRERLWRQRGSRRPRSAGVHGARARTSVRPRAAAAVDGVQQARERLHAR